MARLRRGDRLRGAISHLKKGELTRQLNEAVGRGVSVELLVHDTERRVPSELVDELSRSGIDIVRVAGRDDLPMHAKFVLIEARENPRGLAGELQLQQAVEAPKCRNPDADRGWSGSRRSSGDSK